MIYDTYVYLMIICRKNCEK